MIIEKMSKKRAYNIKTDDGYLVGMIDYYEQHWRFNTEPTIFYSADSLRQLVEFMDSLKDIEGDRAVYG
jgi:dissimilatory sulfite reductase (desulfoviridin) alpha/beta subunit